jgi:tetratricopeptide (TPR) repeat protein
MARRLADKATLADVLASIHWSLRNPDALGESSSMADELAVLAEELGDARLRALAHMWRLDLLLTLADIEAVERELDALERLARMRPDRYLTWLVRVLRASYAILQGRHEDGETLARDALAHRFVGHDETADRVFVAHMTFIRIGQGRVGELIDTLKSTAEPSPKVPSSRCLVALLDAHSGDIAHAREELAALAHADFTDLPRDESWLLNMTTLSGTVFLLGDAPRARLLYELLLPYADRCVVSTALVCLGSASRPLGMLAATIGEYDDARRHFEHAMTVNAQIRSPTWIAYTQQDYARMLLLRDGPGDRAEAQRRLDQAHAIGDRLGLHGPAGHGDLDGREAEAA